MSRIDRTSTRQVGRTICLLAAANISLLLLVYPFAFGRALTSRDHLGLTILLFGVSAAFVHGFGYVAERRLWRAMFSPLVAWACIACGTALLVTS